MHLGRRTETVLHHQDKAALGNWPFPASPVVNCPDFAATVTDFFVLLLMQNETERDSFCGACGHQLQDLTHLPLEYPLSKPL